MNPDLLYDEDEAQPSDLGPRAESEVETLTVSPATPTAFLQMSGSSIALHSHLSSFDASELATR